MGLYDVPAVLKYILTTTGQKQIDYAGHSMGSAMFFVSYELRISFRFKLTMGLCGSALLDCHAVPPGTQFLHSADERPCTRGVRGTCAVSFGVVDHSHTGYRHDGCR